MHKIFILSGIQFNSSVILKFGKNISWTQDKVYNNNMHHLEKTAMTFKKTPNWDKLRGMK